MYIECTVAKKVFDDLMSSETFEYLKKHLKFINTTSLHSQKKSNSFRFLRLWSLRVRQNNKKNNIIDFNLAGSHGKTKRRTFQREFDISVIRWYYDCGQNILHTVSFF